MLETIKKKAEELVKKIQSDPALLKKFKENPIKVVEDLIGIDLPDDQINAVIKAIKAKLELDDVADVAGKLLGGLFGKELRKRKKAFP